MSTEVARSRLILLSVFETRHCVKLAALIYRVAVARILLSTVAVGVWLDNELSLKQHVAKVASECYYQLRRLRQIRRRAGREVTTRLVLALVICRLD